MEQTDIDKKMAEIEGNLSVWGNRTEVRWLLDQLKACRDALELKELEAIEEEKERYEQD